MTGGLWGRYIDFISDFLINLIRTNWLDNDVLHFWRHLVGIYKKPTVFAKQVQLKPKDESIIIMVAPPGQSYPAAPGPVVFWLFVGDGAGGDTQFLSGRIPGHFRSTLFILLSPF